MTTTKPFQLGSVSSGTLRTEDLLPVFAAAVLRLEPETFMHSAQNPFPDDEQLAFFEHVLENLCPPFVYFGAHPDDGADFGFWPDWDALEEERHYSTVAPCDCGQDLDEDWCASNDKTQAYLEDSNIIVQVNDHGNVTVMDMNRNELWSIV